MRHFSLSHRVSAQILCVASVMRPSVQQLRVPSCNSSLVCGHHAYEPEQEPFDPFQRQATLKAAVAVSDVPNLELGRRNELMKMHHCMQDAALNAQTSLSRDDLALQFDLLDAYSRNRAASGRLFGFFHTGPDTSRKLKEIEWPTSAGVKLGAQVRDGSSAEVPELCR